MADNLQYVVVIPVQTNGTYLNEWFLYEKCIWMDGYYYYLGDYESATKIKSDIFFFHKTSTDHYGPFKLMLHDLQDVRYDVKLQYMII